MNPPNILDPGHTTTRLSAEQMIHFARVVGLEVTLTSYGLLEDLILRARAVKGFGV